MNVDDIRNTVEQAKLLKDYAMTIMTSGMAVTVIGGLLALKVAKKAMSLIIGLGLIVCVIGYLAYTNKIDISFLIR